MDNQKTQYPTEISDPLFLSSEDNDLLSSKGMCGKVHCCDVKRSVWHDALCRAAKENVVPSKCIWDTPAK